MSENRNLMRDAVRDWTALGGPADFVFDLGACKGPIPRADGICFASYDTLKGKPREKDGVESGIDRLEQVVAWLAGGGEEADFEGVVVFDESHNAMASALDTQGSRGVKKSLATGAGRRRSARPAPERPHRLRQRDRGHRGRRTSPTPPASASGAAAPRFRRSRLSSRRCRRAASRRWSWWRRT